MVSIFGDASSGKNAPLNLLSNKVFPPIGCLEAHVQCYGGGSSGGGGGGGGGEDPEAPSPRGAAAAASRFFVPAHLRVATVPPDPVVLGPEDSIKDNLMYGLKVTWGKVPGGEQDRGSAGRASASAALRR